MKCPACGHENLDGDNFCNECGSKLELACPQCGRVNPPGSIFCANCGQPLSAPSKPTHKDLTPKNLSFDEKLAKIQKYLPGNITEKILSQRNRIEGERKQVTVLFTDMAGYTTMSEKLDAEEVYSLMDQIYEILIHKVTEYGGTVNEFTGDGIMALFGAPIALEDAPQRAIRASLAIHREIVQFNGRSLDYFFTVGTVELQYGALFVLKGEGENAIKHCQSAFEYFKKVDSVVYLPLAWGYLGHGYYLLGEFKRAQKYIEKGLEVQQDIGLSFYLSYIYTFLSMIHADSGHWEEAKAQAEEALKFAQTNQLKQNEGWSWLLVGRADGKMEKVKLFMAEESIFKGMKILKELKLKPWFSQGHLYLGELYADAGLKEKALENLKEAEGLFQEMGMDYWLNRTKKILETLK